jgi:trimethylamine--corrinoid protein Co-methyltransferase
MLADSDVSGGGRLDRLSVRVFGADEIEEIHDGTLWVLEHVGVLVDSPAARQIFDSGGCRVDAQTGMVKFPPYVVQEAIASAPREVIFAGRDADHDVVVGEGSMVFQNFGIAPKIVDPETRAIRPSTKDDIETCARMCDAMSELGIFEMALTAEDMPPATANVHSVEAALVGGRKAVCAATLTTAETEACIDMAAAVVGGREKLSTRSLIYAGVCPVSPLRLTPELTEPTIAMAKAGLITAFLSEVMSGATAPITVAGSIVVHAAEMLASVSLAQLVRRGTPVVVGGTSGPMDMRWGTASGGAPEFALCNAGLAQLAHFWALPSMLAGL